MDGWGPTNTQTQIITANLQQMLLERCRGKMQTSTKFLIRILHGYFPAVTCSLHSLSALMVLVWRLAAHL